MEPNTPTHQRLTEMLRYALLLASATMTTANAGETTFTWTCLQTTTNAFCNALSASSNSWATITFSSPEPVDGTLFSGSEATVRIGSQGHQAMYTLPATYKYYYGDLATHVPNTWVRGDNLNIIGSPTIGTLASAPPTKDQFDNGIYFQIQGGTEQFPAPFGQFALLGTFSTHPNWSYSYDYLLGTFKADVAPKQVVYLDFGADSAAVYRRDKVFSSINAAYNKQDAGLNQDRVNAITLSLQNIYNKYGVQFTTIKPASGPFHTIYIGGTSADIFAANNTLAGTIADTTVGIAQSINVMNSQKSESAVVFSANLALRPGDDAQLTQIIAHESGHILGLQHVTPSTELLYPLASNDATVISNSRVPVGHLTSSDKVVASAIGFTQNSGADLLCAVGDAHGVKSCLDADSYKWLSVNFGVLSTIYNTKIILSLPDDPSSDSSLSVLALGDLQPGSNAKFRFPVFQGEKIILIGSSTTTGEGDIFASDSVTFSGNTQTQDDIAFGIGDSTGATQPFRLYFYKIRNDGSVTNFGQGSITSVPEPYSVILILLGIPIIIARKVTS